MHPVLSMRFLTGGIASLQKVRLKATGIIVVSTAITMHLGMKRNTGWCRYRYNVLRAERVPLQAGGNLAKKCEILNLKKFKN